MPSVSRPRELPTCILATGIAPRFPKVTSNGLSYRSIVPATGLVCGNTTSTYIVVVIGPSQGQHKPTLISC
ncbi:hypothetical protein V2G26_020067 [Clonostachys chloroleuca]